MPFLTFSVGRKCAQWLHKLHFTERIETSTKSTAPLHFALFVFSFLCFRSVALPLVCTLSINFSDGVLQEFIETGNAQRRKKGRKGMKERKKKGRKEERKKGKKEKGRKAEGGRKEKDRKEEGRGRKTKGGGKQKGKGKAER